MIKRITTAICLLTTMVVNAWAQQTEEVTYPQAEWCRATDILVHTPGEELFNGVIHPSAGLFEKYFDANKAADEHKGYIHMLENNGINVYRVSDILNEVDIEELRVLAADVLTYDVSELPSEEQIQQEEYRQDVLKKMSRSDLIRCIILQPTVKLTKTSGNTGYQAQYIQNPLMNLYFTRDQSITTPKGHIICNMNSIQRALETKIIELCYKYAEQITILQISGTGRLEGGDYIPAGTISLIGCGMRTNDEGIRQMLDADAFGHDTVVVVRDHKLWQKQMHLDTHFNIIDKDLCTMVSSRLNANPGDPEYNTCDIWAREPGTKEYTLWKKDLSFVEYIRSRGFDIIPIDEADEDHYANNFLTIAPRHIMAVAGQSAELQKRFSDAGVKVEWVPLENLIDGFGAAHCMTQVLRRERFTPPQPSSVNNVKSNASTTTKAYHLNGTVADKGDQGIIIEEGKKYIRN